ncbi:MAG TPA: hypothetical protein VFV86_09750 [Nitrososphaeraceae archaeon]|nr:hypothetical protein [Nitrososphaeraceae archaeon]
MAILLAFLVNGKGLVPFGELTIIHPIVLLPLFLKRLVESFIVIILNELSNNDFMYNN